MTKLVNVLIYDPPSGYIKYHAGKCTNPREVSFVYLMSWVARNATQDVYYVWDGDLFVHVHDVVAIQQAFPPELSLLDRILSSCKNVW